MINMLGWKNLPKNMGNQLHSICSYMAMFPPTLPNYFIKKYSNVGEKVLDPFSGRGTTVLEACVLERIGIGNDKNPLAYLLTKVKSDVPQKGRIISKINTLQEKFEQSEINIESERPEIKMIFSDYTLKQLVFMKQNLKWRTSNVDAFITAMLLGILHGNSEGYLSLSMPNTFSMSPNYIKGYIQKHDLKKPERDVFSNLLKKLDRCYQRPKIKGTVYHQDGRSMSKIDDKSINLIVTSPPYLKVIRYGQFNWIRLWFLNRTGEETDKQLILTESVNKYLDFMNSTLEEMKRVLKDDGKAVLVLGDVKNRDSDKVNNLAELVLERCAEPLGFHLVEPIISDTISDESKVSKIWGEGKRGHATQIDRILVLSKSPPALYTTLFTGLRNMFVNVWRA